MWRVALLLCACGLAAARRSPHADLIEEYYGPGGPESGRFSDNIMEDALLDAPGLIAKYRYPVEVHKVVTDDGYILEMHRIPYGRDRNNFYDPRKPVVFLMHGLLSSSADWVVMGPGSAIGYELAEQGYDVWLGNARGNYYSRNHVSLNPDNTRHNFWRFSWDEIGTNDLPAMIDYALRITGKSRLHYIGHSQGTTAFWAMASLRPENNAKIISMQAFAPVAYMTHIEHPLLVGLAPHADSIETVANLVGINEFFPNSELSTQLGQTFCRDGVPTQLICSNILFIVAGRSVDMHNATMLPVKLSNTPAGAALRQLVHYGQLIRKDYFRRYDHGSLTNLRVYGSFTPPTYDLSRITAPVFLHYVDFDVFAHVTDVQRLNRELGQSVGMFRIPHATFSHLDFVWGTGAMDLLYLRTINLMKSMGDD